MAVLVLGPGILRDRTLDGEAVSFGHGVEVLGHDTFGVDLDEEVHVTFVVLIGDGGVGTYRGLLGVFGFVLGDYRSCGPLAYTRPTTIIVLTGNRQARDHIIFWQGKHESLGIVVVVFDVHQLQVKEALVTTRERLLLSGRLSVNIALVAEITVTEGTCADSSS